MGLFYLSSLPGFDPGSAGAKVPCFSIMAKYRKKPIIIEATQWSGFEQGPHDLGIILLSPEKPGMGWIGTLEGGHEVTPGDWIITGIKGEKYPCKPEATYEPVE